MVEIASNTYFGHTYVTEDEETDPGYGFYLTEDDRVYYLDEEGFEYRPNPLLDPASADVYGIKYVCCDQGIHYYQVQDEMYQDDASDTHLMADGEEFSELTTECTEDVEVVSAISALSPLLTRSNSAPDLFGITDDESTHARPTTTRSASSASLNMLDMDSEDEEEAEEAIRKWSESNPTPTPSISPKPQKKVVPSRTKVIADIPETKERRSSGNHKKSKRGRRSRSRSASRVQGEDKPRERERRTMRNQDRSVSARELQEGRRVRSKSSRSRLQHEGGKEEEKKSRRSRSRSSTGTLDKGAEEGDIRKKNRRSRSRSNRDILATGPEEENGRKSRRSRSRSTGCKLAAGKEREETPKKDRRSRSRSNREALNAGQEETSVSSGTKDKSLTPRKTNVRRSRSSGMINVEAAAASSPGAKPRRSRSGGMMDFEAPDRSDERDDAMVTLGKRTQSRRSGAARSRADRLSQRNLMRQRCAAAMEHGQTRRGQKEEESKVDRIRELEDTVASLQKKMFEDQDKPKEEAAAAATAASKKRVSVFGLGLAGMAGLEATKGLTTIATATVGATVLMGKTAVNTAYGAGKLASSAGLAATHVATHAAAGAVDMLASQTASPASA